MSKLFVIVLFYTSYIDHLLTSLFNGAKIDKNIPPNLKICIVSRVLDQFGHIYMTHVKKMDCVLHKNKRKYVSDTKYIQLETMNFLGAVSSRLPGPRRCSVYIC